MRIYWKLADIPELANLAPQHRKQIWRRAKMRVLLQPLPLVLLVACCFGQALLIEAIRDRFESLSPALSASLLFPLIWAFPLSQWLAERARLEIRNLLESGR
jgi:hypothetical protein